MMKPVTFSLMINGINSSPDSPKESVKTNERSAVVKKAEDVRELIKSMEKYHEEYSKENMNPTSDDKDKRIASASETNKTLPEEENLEMNLEEMNSDTDDNRKMSYNTWYKAHQQVFEDFPFATRSQCFYWSAGGRKEYKNGPYVSHKEPGYWAVVTDDATTNGGCGQKLVNKNPQGSPKCECKEIFNEFLQMPAVCGFHDAVDTYAWCYVAAGTCINDIGGRNGPFVRCDGN